MKGLYVLFFMMFTAFAHAGQVQHFVAFKFADSVSKEDRSLVMKKFLALKNNCKQNGKPYIVSIKAGKANSPEGADQNFEQGYIVTFKSEADRDFYVGKPFFTNFDEAHDQFKQFVGPLLAKENGVFVFDFTVKD